MFEGIMIIIKIIGVIILLALWGKLLQFIEYIAYDISSILALLIGIIPPLLIVYYGIRTYKKDIHSASSEKRKEFWSTFLGGFSSYCLIISLPATIDGISALNLYLLSDSPKEYLKTLKDTKFKGSHNERWLKELKRLDYDAYLSEIKRQNNEKNKKEKEKLIKKIAEKNAELAKNIKISGTVHCQSLVRKELKSPYSAEFPWGMHELAVVHNTNKTINLNGYVDSQNYYGAMIRSNFNCSLKYNGNEINDIRNWTIQNINVK